MTYFEYSDPETNHKLLLDMSHSTGDAGWGYTLNTYAFDKDGQNVTEVPADVFARFNTVTNNIFKVFSKNGGEPDNSIAQARGSRIIPSGSSADTALAEIPQTRIYLHKRDAAQTPDAGAKHHRFVQASIGAEGMQRLDGAPDYFTTFQNHIIKQELAAHNSGTKPTANQRTGTEEVMETKKFECKHEKTGFKMVVTLQPVETHPDIKGTTIGLRAAFFMPNGALVDLNKHNSKGTDGTPIPNAALAQFGAQLQGMRDVLSQEHGFSVGDQIGNVVAPGENLSSVGFFSRDKALAPKELPQIHAAFERAANNPAAHPLSPLGRVATSTLVQNTTPGVGGNTTPGTSWAARTEKRSDQEPRTPG